MKNRKMLTVLTASALCLSLFTGCGESGQPVSNDTAKEDTGTQESSDAQENADAPESDTPQESDADESGADTRTQDGQSSDPSEMITQGYYSYTYPVEGMDDMCAFFHFYEEQPVLGSVFYAGYAWNQITYVGTYQVEEKESSYSCIATREDQEADPKKMTDGTAPYTVTFYDFDGTELGSCGFDGEILYNDSAIAGTGAEECMFYHDTDTDSPYMATYEGEAGVAYLDFVAEDPTSTLTLYHNGRYTDLVSMLVEGTWTMAEGTDGYEYTLTPDSDTDTGAVAAVSNDEQTCTYTPEGGEAVSMTNVKASGPAVQMSMTGTTPIPGQDTEADIMGSLYDDGTVKVAASAFGSEIELDAGTWSMGEDGFTITFQFDNAGELVSALGESGAALQYVSASEMLGDIDVQLVITIAQ